GEIAAAAVVPEDALEPALRAILEASRAQAGALCLFDQRQGLLRLVAEIGLSEEGCRRLRNARRTDPTAWDMPLNGLLNRRAYLIESVARNRYVPRLVEHAAAVRTIACIPLHAGPTPVGSLVLIALAPRSFAERDVRTLERPLGELAAMIEAVRRRGGVEPVGAPRAPGAAGRGARDRGGRARRAGARRGGARGGACLGRACDGERDRRPRGGAPGGRGERGDGGGARRGAGGRGRAPAHAGGGGRGGRGW